MLIQFVSYFLSNSSVLFDEIEEESLQTSNNNKLGIQP